MAHRAYIAKVERDGSGRYIYLGHSSYPTGAGAILLEHYQDPDKTDALISMGSIPQVAPELHDVEPYYPHDDREWQGNQPVPFTGGTDTFFLSAYMPGPEWLYAWTPDGWLAAPVRSHDMPPSLPPALFAPQLFSSPFPLNPLSPLHPFLQPGFSQPFPIPPDQLSPSALHPQFQKAFFGP